MELANHNPLMTPLPNVKPLIQNLEELELLNEMDEKKKMGNNIVFRTLFLEAAGTILNFLKNKIQSEPNSFRNFS